jgi:hypothetical protein
MVVGNRKQRLPTVSARSGSPPSSKCRATFGLRRLFRKTSVQMSNSLPVFPTLVIFRRLCVAPRFLQLCGLQGVTHRTAQQA